MRISDDRYNRDRLRIEDIANLRTCVRVERDVVVHEAEHIRRSGKAGALIALPGRASADAGHLAHRPRHDSRR